jgi:hypothetical protein
MSAPVAEAVRRTMSKARSGALSLERQILTTLSISWARS